MVDVRVEPSAIAELCVTAACLLAVGALGGAAPFALVPFAALALGALFFCALSARRADPLRMPRLAWVFVIATGACALQLLPLPLPVLSLLSPEAAEIVRFNLEPLGLSTVRPISLEPSATARELVKAVSFGALIISAAYLGRSRSSRRRLQLFLAGLGVAVSLTAVVHALLGAEELFGVYRFTTTPPLVTPFGNPNHLAGFLTVAATLTLGLFLESRGGAIRLTLSLAYLLQAAVVMFSSSRAGIAFFVLAQLLLAASAVRARRGSEAGLPTRAIAIGAAICALALGAYVGWDRLTVEYESTASVDKVRESKVSLWPDFARGASAFSRMGMGRGAFELGYARYHPRPSYYSFTHPENELLQLWAEDGALFAALIIVVALWAYAALFRREALSLTDLATLAAAAAVALHNLFDFSFELLAVPAVLCVLLGLVSRREVEPAPLSLEKGRAFGVVGMAALLAVLGASLGRHSFREAERNLVATPDAKATEASALPLINRHPADGLLYAAVGLSYAADPAADQRTALAWLNRGLYLAPWDGPSHQAVARALLRLGRRPQAFGEYRLALESHLGVTNHAIYEEVVRAAKTADELLRASPRDADHIALIAAFAERRGDPRLMIDYLSSVIPEVDATKTRVPLLVRLARFQRMVNAFDEAAKTLELAQRIDPNEAAVTIERAALLDALGKPDEATALLESQLTRYPGDFRLHMELVARYAAQDPNKALTAIGRARAFADSAAQQYELFAAEARVYAMMERYARAVQSAETAARLAPTNAGIHYAVADLYAKLDRFSDARQWLNEGMAVDSKEGAKAAEDARKQSWAVAEQQLNEKREKALLQEAGP